MKTRICFENKTLSAWPIRLVQTSVDKFSVTYGQQIKVGLDYNHAATELGSCIMHALACKGKLDNREKGQH